MNREMLKVMFVCLCLILVPTAYVVILETTKTSVAAPVPQIVEVRCVSVHIHGHGQNVWTDPFSHMVVERLDTKERRAMKAILASPGEVFRIDWNSPFYK